jgi:diguanylate cyclase (GGDEF)-like protein
MELSARTPAQRAVMTYAWDSFLTHSEWPRARKVEVDLANLIEHEGGLKAVCDAIGRERIICEDLLSSDAKVKLRIRGIAECPRTGQEVDAFFTLLRYAAFCYARDTEAWITPEDFTTRSGVEPDLAARAFQYAMLDGGRFWRSGSSASLLLDRFARRLGNVHSFEDLDEQVRREDAEFQSSVVSSRAVPIAVGEAPPATPDDEDGGAVEVDLDPVMGVASRKALERDLPAYFARAESTGLPLSLIMVDADHFKSVNDSHGHPKGDEVLRAIAQCVQAVVEGKGTLYRYGGEELTMLLPNHSRDEAVAVAERARVAVEDSRPGALDVTISAGIATLPTHSTTVTGLFEAADEALYAAKELGRNLVRVVDDAVPSAGGGASRAERKLPVRPLVLSLTSREGQIESGREEYTLEVWAENTGDSVLTDWTAQLDVPLALVPDGGASSFRVDNRKDPELASFRITQEEHSGKPIYPEDNLKVFNFHIVLTDTVYARNPKVMDCPVRARLYVGSDVKADERRPLAEVLGRGKV